VLNTLRKKGINSELYPDEAKMKKQFRYADKKGILFVAIIGPDETQRNIVSLKNMATGEQQSLTVDELIRKLS